MLVDFFGTELKDNDFIIYAGDQGFEVYQIHALLHQVNGLSVYPLSRKKGSDRYVLEETPVCIYELSSVMKIKPPLISYCHIPVYCFNIIGNDHQQITHPQEEIRP